MATNAYVKLTPDFNGHQRGIKFFQRKSTFNA